MCTGATAATKIGDQQFVETPAAMADGPRPLRSGLATASFGVGPPLDNGVGLPTIYGFAAVIAVSMGLLSFVVARPGVSGRQRVRSEQSREGQPA